jgi:superfamily II RNA helicase
VTSLEARVPLGATIRDPGAILDRFLGWVSETGLVPYPAQEEALLELMADRHVVLSTPTGSGKSLVALGLHFKARCEGKRSFYTAPVKALVSEKFFALCGVFGPENVGMLTGDVSLNWAAPIICCTTEVLANMALRQGEATDAPYAVMDEFHYYSDRDRGSAWQIPLLTLTHTTFLLMSATLGNTAIIEEKLRERSGREVSHVHSDERPVPLDFTYQERPIHETVEQLLQADKAPIYIVSFTQRECAELGQALTSAKVSSREEKRGIAEAVGGFRFDTPYGKEVRRMIGHGIGIHHAGLLPKYRLLVEQLSQRGLLKVICGTDTLGVGVNIPIRTVVFTKLCKFDGEKVRILSSRDFKQIAGRCGRKGFDDRGSVVCQAPDHVIENKRIAEKGARSGGKKKLVKKKAPPRGFVTWNRQTFDQLVTRPPERLISRFQVNHGMVVAVLQGRGYRWLGEIIDRCHEEPKRKRHLRRQAAERFRSLRRAGIVDLMREGESGRYVVRVSEDLQRDFSLHGTLSLYLIEALEVLDRDEPSYPLDVLSLVEAVLEDPTPILRQQVAKLKTELMARLKADRVPYEERIEKLDQVEHPKPNAEFVYATFGIFAERHPWTSRENVRPKSVAREMVEIYSRFDSYVQLYGLQRSEGLLLRYLGQVYRTLSRSVPDAAKSDEIHDILAYLRTMIERVDSSLFEEWERQLHPEVERAGAAETPKLDLALTPKAFRARVRSEMRELVRALSEQDYEEAARCVRQDPDDPWGADRFAEALAPFHDEYERILFDPDARQAHRTAIRQTAPRIWEVQQVLADPQGDDIWSLQGEIDLRGEVSEDHPLVRVRAIAT